MSTWSVVNYAGWIALGMLTAMSGLTFSSPYCWMLLCCVAVIQLSALKRGGR